MGEEFDYALLAMQSTEACWRRLGVDTPAAAKEL